MSRALRGVVRTGGAVVLFALCYGGGRYWLREVAVWQACRRDGRTIQIEAIIIMRPRPSVWWVET